MTELPVYGNRCPLCGWTSSACHQRDTGDYLIECQQCGKYEAEEEFIEDLPASNAAELLPYLSAHTRQTWEALHKPALLTNSNWRSLAEAHQHTSRQQRAEKVLRFLASRSEFPGAPVKPAWERNYPLADCKNQQEMLFYDGDLRVRGWVEGDKEFRTVTMAGWDQLDPASGGAGIPGRVFVAMSFHDELADAWTNGFDAALRDCGLDPVRVDRDAFTEKICDHIMVEIRRAQLVVADFTRQRPNVYYEAGFAEALGRTVVHCCRKDWFPTIETEGFDVRQYPFIVWKEKDYTDLRTQLTDRVRGLGLARKL